MNKEKQRIAIAEAIGWTDVKGTKGVHPKARFKGRGYADDWIALPDYLSDLNAMHDAEKMMTKDQWLWYTVNLLLAAKDGSFVIDVNMKTMAHATAAQRAEAFLRTIGKWEE
jgi:hypothetical protein